MPQHDNATPAPDAAYTVRETIREIMQNLLSQLNAMQLDNEVEQRVSDCWEKAGDLFVVLTHLSTSLCEELPSGATATPSASPPPPTSWRPHSTLTIPPPSEKGPVDWMIVYQMLTRARLELARLRDEHPTPPLVMQGMMLTIADAGLVEQVWREAKAAQEHLLDLLDDCLETTVVNGKAGPQEGQKGGV